MSNLKYYLTPIAIFTVLFTARLWQVEGFHGYYSDIELENLSLVFEPWRLYLSSVFSGYFDPEVASILSGIVLGMKSQLSTDLKTALINTSTIHIVVVSGQNLSLLVSSLAYLNGWIGKKAAISLAFIVIIIYSLITGLQIPIIRAAIMAGMSLVAQVLGKQRESVWLLFLSGGIMLIYEPRWLFSISFQLSFTATLATIVLTPYISARLRFIPQIFKPDFANAIAVQLLIWPLIAYYFQQASLVGIFVNSLVLWTIGPIMISGGGVLILSHISEDLTRWYSVIPNLLVSFLLKVITFANSIKMNHIEDIVISISMVVGYYLLFIGVYLLLKRKGYYNNPK